jgi:hypothetical protein
MDLGVIQSGKVFLKAAGDIKLAVTQKKIAEANLREDERKLLTDMFREGWEQDARNGGRIHGRGHRPCDGAVRQGDRDHRPEHQQQRDSHGTVRAQLCQPGIRRGSRGDHV